MPDQESMIPDHGGFRNLKTFQLAQLIYDVTVRFGELYIRHYSRTRDQMEQAARSGVQNIAEGSKVSATSRKNELKLTGVARASLEELRLDYEDFLRQRGLTQWGPEHPALVRFKRKQCATLKEVRAWVAEEQRLAQADTDQHGQTPTDTDQHGHTRTDADTHGPTRAFRDQPGLTGTRRPAWTDGQPGRNQGTTPHNPDTPRRGIPTQAELVANAALSLLNLCSYLLGRQLHAQADAFEREGGLTERLYRRRKERRQEQGE